MQRVYQQKAPQRSVNVKHGTAAGGLIRRRQEHFIDNGYKQEHILQTLLPATTDLLPTPGGGGSTFVNKTQDFCSQRFTLSECCTFVGCLIKGDSRVKNSQGINTDKEGFYHTEKNRYKK